MKTIKQIADELGVSKQAVHQKIKREPLSSKMKLFTSTVDNVIYIDDNGELLIKAAFIKPPSTVDGSVVGLLRENLVVLQAQLSEKDKQLSEKDKQIAALTETVKSQAQSINADRHTNLAETLQPLIGANVGEVSDDERGGTTPKRGIFGLFRKK